MVDATGATDLLVTNTHSPAGQFSAYTFSVPANTLGLQVSLTNTTGNPNMYLRADTQLPGGADGYGNNGGQGPGPGWSSTTLINIASPVATNYTLMVQAESAGGDASFTVRVHAIGPIRGEFRRRRQPRWRTRRTTSGNISRSRCHRMRWDGICD